MRKKFRVISPIQNGTSAKDARRYEVGDIIELTKEQHVELAHAVSGEWLEEVEEKKEEKK